MSRKANVAHGLNDQAAGLHLAADSLARLNVAIVEELDQAVSQVLEQVGWARALDRIVFCYIDAAGRRLVPEFDWNRNPDAAPRHLFLKHIDLPAAERVGLLHDGSRVHEYADVSLLAADDPIRQVGYRIPTGGLMFAVVSGARGARCLLSFHTLDQPRPWTDGDRLIAQLLAEGLLAVRTRAEAERAAARERQRYRKFLEHSGTAVWCWQFDPPCDFDAPVAEIVRRIGDAPFVEANQAFCDVRGFSGPDAVVGRTWRELHAADAPATIVAYADWLGRLLHRSGRIVRGDGPDPRFYQVDTHRDVLPDGRVHHLWGTLTDVTELERTRRQIAVSEARLQEWVAHTEHVLFCTEFVEPFDPQRQDDVSAALTEAFLASRIVDCTDSYAHWHGRARREEMLGIEVRQLDTRFRRSDVAGLLSAFAATHCREVEGLYRTHDGTRYFRSRMQGAFDASGRLIRIWNALTDETASATTQIRLREERERNQRLMHVTRERVICVEFDVPVDASQSDAQLEAAIFSSRIVELSNVSARLIGYRDRNEAIGQTLGRLLPGMHPDLFAAILSHIRDPEFSSEGLRLDFDETDPVPETRTYQAVIEPIRQHGRVRQLWVRLRDITDEHRARLALEESERLRALAMASARLFLARFDAPDDIWVQPEGVAALGIEPPGPRDVGSLLAAVHPEDRADVERRLQGFAADSASGLHLSARIIRPEREPRWIEIWAIRVDATPGLPRRAVGVFRDVTESRALERRMLSSQKLESLGVLAGGIAHDFNNLLMSMLGYAQIASEAAPPGVAAALAEIEKAARRASDLCNQLLAYAGGKALQQRDVDLVALVNELANLLDVSISAGSEVEIEHARSRLGVRADPAQLTQVVMNLIVNASDAMGDTRGTIRLRSRAVMVNGDHEDPELHAPLPAGDYALLEVIDSGCGMAAAVRERMFDPFFSTKFAGRGLGMAAVLGIVQAHEGGISVHSVEGDGTRVSVYLPLVDLVSVEAPAEPAGTPFPRGLALVVDDERTVREVSTAMLEHLGFEVITAADGRAGLRVHAERRAELTLVVADLTMPGLDGVETVRAMIEQGGAMRYLVASGYGPDGVPEDLRQAGVGFLHKPYSLATLEKALGGSGGEHVDAGGNGS